MRTLASINFRFPWAKLARRLKCMAVNHLVDDVGPLAAHHLVVNDDEEGDPEITGRRMPTSWE